MRVTRLMWAMISHASALAMDVSQSFVIGRHFPNDAKALSATHRRGMTTKPGAVSERLTICNVQRPVFSSAPSAWDQRSVYMQKYGATADKRSQWV